MLAVRLPQSIEKRLEKLARRTGRTKTYYVREAILEHLEKIDRGPVFGRRCPGTPSVVRAKPAMCGHFKTGHMRWPRTWSLFISLSPDQASLF